MTTIQWDAEVPLRIEIQSTATENSEGIHEVLRPGVQSLLFDWESARALLLHTDVARENPHT